jgi:thiamine kinase-like enzyme
MVICFREINMELPETLQELSTEWLTHVLRQSGTLQTSSVRSVEIISEAIGNGMAAQISRISLEYDREEDGQPRTLVVKRPAIDPNLRGFFQNIVGAYAREVFFYNEIARNIQTRSPHCYFAAYTPEPPNMVLLMEDLTSYENGDWSAGCTLDQARIILREMAFLHSTWWMSPELNELEILMSVDKFPHSMLDKEFTSQWPVALEVLGFDEIEAYRAICKAIEGRIEPEFIALSNPPLTMSHLDFQLDNMVFGIQPNQAPFILLDWAIVGVANAAFDLAFFISQNLDTPLRREHELELINEYLTTLAERGVTDYTLETCLKAYCSALLPILQRIIAALYSQRPLTAEKARALRIIISRLLETIIDHYNNQNFASPLPGGATVR